MEHRKTFTMRDGGSGKPLHKLPWRISINSSRGSETEVPFIMFEEEVREYRHDSDDVVDEKVIKYPWKKLRLMFENRWENERGETYAAKLGSAFQFVEQGTHILVLTSNIELRMWAQFFRIECSRVCVLVDEWE